MVSEVDVSSKTTHIGLVRFSDSASVHFELNTHDTEAKVNAAVDSLVYKGGWTYTDRALDTTAGVFNK